MQPHVREVTMEFKAKWIGSTAGITDTVPVFRKEITLRGEVKKADLYISALGVYVARINGEQIGNFVLAPGWTVYEKRVQYQQYDVTEKLRENNTVEVLVGKGWFSSQMPGWKLSQDRIRRTGRQTAFIAELHVIYSDDQVDVFSTDESWLWSNSPTKFSEIYDGEVYDATYESEKWESVAELNYEKDLLIPQEGPEIHEVERVYVKNIIKTPKGEILVDFGQEITGYVEFTVNAEKGDRIRIQHGEVLDKDGNFYNENYRDAKAEILYICSEGRQTWHPALTFFGFRYIKLVEFPGEVSCEQFTGIVVHSDMKRTGYLRCGIEKLNQLFSNVLWGQRGNFLDVPTDCPQRDERLGWTGDAQVFIKTATYNYDVEKFFIKWLHDLKAAQRPSGSVGQVIPDYLPEGEESAAWGDAATICPWQIYQTYGNREILEDQFESMTKWVDFIGNATLKPFLWIGGTHFGDWLGLDAESGSYKGASRDDFIASAFYAYSTELVIKTGKVLGKDITKYEKLYRNIVKAFREEFPDCRTQTELVLAVRFGLTEKPEELVEQLVERIEKAGMQIQTGFVGTPYILHVLSEYGYSELAYTLFLREKYPSWLYPVNQGATTIWEHWDGIMENGDFWSPDMNSYNHYAYGAVADWVYEKAAGICLIEEFPGFEKVRIRPMPDKRLHWLEASIETKHGMIKSAWYCQGDEVRYEIIIPVEGQIVIGKKIYELKPGEYIFWDYI